MRTLTVLTESAPAGEPAEAMEAPAVRILQVVTHASVPAGVRATSLGCANMQHTETHRGQEEDGKQRANLFRSTRFRLSPRPGDLTHARGFRGYSRELAADTVGI